MERLSVRDRSNVQVIARNVRWRFQEIHFVFYPKSISQYLKEYNKYKYS